MQVSEIKTKLKTMLKLLGKPQKMVYPLAQNGFFKHIPDALFLRMVYRAELGKKLDLKDPKDFSEKLQWLKLHDRNPDYIAMVDKYLVKQIISDRIGKEYVIPTIGAWDRAEDIDFDVLPDSFVLKCNHDSGGIVICREKASLDRDKAVSRLKAHMDRDSFSFGREWPYRSVKKKIIAEELLSDPEHKDLIDYKIYCFNGEPAYFQIIQNRSIKETLDFYDLEWNRMPFSGLVAVEKGSQNGPLIEKPRNLSIMTDIARELAKGTRFVRIDLYNIEGKIYFGEFTLYPKSGFGVFVPEEWNRKMGDLIKL